MKPLRAYSNVFKLRINMLLKREIVDNYPIVAYIEPTAFCNLRCPACPTGLRLELRPSARMKMELFQALMDDIGDYVFELVMYNWGEPLLHSQTPEMIAVAKARHMSVSLSTNFSLDLTDTYLERLVESGLDRLVVSMDGASSEVYERYRKGGDHDLVRRNMLRLREIKRRVGRTNPTVEWQFLVFRHNEHEIGLVRASYREWGADELTIEGAQLPSPPHDEGYESSSIPEHDIYHPDHSYRRRSMDQLESNRPCSWLYGAVVVNPNASVSPCCATAAERDDFGVYDPQDGYFGLANGPRYRQARRLFGRGRRDDGVVNSNSPGLRGMSAHVSDELMNGELICNRCPMSFRQDDIHKAIARQAYGTLKQAFRCRSVRLLIGFVMMGGPNVAGMRWVLGRIAGRIAGD